MNVSAACACTHYTWIYMKMQMILNLLYLTRDLYNAFHRKYTIYVSAFKWNTESKCRIDDHEILTRLENRFLKVIIHNQTITVMNFISINWNLYFRGGFKLKIYGFLKLMKIIMMLYKLFDMRCTMLKIHIAKVY